MRKRRSGRPDLDGSGLTRRRLLGGTVVGLAALANPRIAGGARRAAGDAAYVPRPNPTRYTLRVGQRPFAPDGAEPAAAVLLDGGLPGPEVRVREGDLLRILVENGLPDAPTAIHWHGVLVPAGMDGVPDISNAPIAPGQTYVYEYPIRQTGTYWYHSHVGFQEQQGCYGAFIVDPARPDPGAARDAVVLLGDWLHRSPADVLAQLRAGGTSQANGPGAPTPPGAMPAGMPMRGMERGGADLADVRYDAFLLNGRGGGDAPWALPVRRGERVRLRLINGGASTVFRVALDGHRLQVTHADGLAVQPVAVDHLLIGMGETYDALVTIAGAGSHTLHAVAQDGSGQALGVLHTPEAAPQPNRGLPSFAGRALSYADLRAPAPTTLPDGPLRSFRLPLQGDMARYVWMIDGQAWPKADPLRIRPGDRVQLELVNETMMWHPMHLHGHFFRLLQGAGAACPLKHTVNVAPRETVRIEFTADNPGRWFFHCHNLYHLEAGMAREIVYEA